MNGEEKAASSGGVMTSFVILKFRAVKMNALRIIKIEEIPDHDHADWVLHVCLENSSKLKY